MSPTHPTLAPAPEPAAPGSGGPGPALSAGGVAAVLAMPRFEADEEDPLPDERTVVLQRPGLRMGDTLLAPLTTPAATPAPIAPALFNPTENEPGPARPIDAGPPRIPDDRPPMPFGDGPRTTVQDLPPTLVDAYHAMCAADGALPGLAAQAAQAANLAGTLPPDPAAADGLVRQVGRYQIVSRLGRGGMATVYRARDPGIGRDVAIKFLHASLCEVPSCRTRFLREARAAGGLTHPNIVVVHDVGEIERRPYLAMELIDGQPLSEVIDQRGPLPLRDAVVIGLQLAQALQYAHQRGIVHRDIKPGNIMLLKGSTTIKVTDFGIAHVDGEGDLQRTRVGEVLGTPQYMSPEQTRGERLDGRSDLFSAGIVIYQMLVGKRPFDGDSLVAVATQVALTEPPSVASRRPEVPAALRRVVERCLCKQPDQRFASGQALADALQQVLASLDEAAQRAARPRMLPLQVKGALTMAATVAVVMGLTASLIFQWQRAALLEQVGDYGHALARFIAAQNAAAVLGEDWDAVDIAVQQVVETRDFERVLVLDRSGTVRVASQPSLVGRPYRPAGEWLAPAAGAATAGTEAATAGTPMRRYLVAGQPVLGFEAPVLFQGKQVGRVALGIAEAPLGRVARQSLLMLAALVAVTVLAAAVAMLLLAQRFNQPLRRLRQAMAALGHGELDHRIAQTRRDELGQLFNDFDTMAQRLQQRWGPQPAAEGAGSGAGSANPSAPAPPGPTAPPAQAAASAPSSQSATVSASAGAAAQVDDADPSPQAGPAAPQAMPAGRPGISTS